jgi:hypothetical protein
MFARRKRETVRALRAERGASTVSSDSSNASDSEGDGGYVHRPGEFDDSESAGSSLGESTAVDEPYTGKADGDGFGKQGWILVAGVVVCFLVIPGVIYLFPAAPAQLGWTFFATFLALPLVPAVLLGLLAVWSMQAAS